MTAVVRNLARTDVLSPACREVLLEIYGLVGGETVSETVGVVEGALHQQLKLAPDYVKRKRYTFERLQHLGLIRLRVYPPEFAVSLTAVGKQVAQDIRAGGGVPGATTLAARRFFEPGHSYVRSAFVDRGPVTHMVFRVEYVGYHPDNADERVAFGWSKYQRDGDLWTPCTQGETAWSVQHWQDLGPTLQVGPETENTGEQEMRR